MRPKLYRGSNDSGYAKRRLAERVAGYQDWTVYWLTARSKDGRWLHVFDAKARTWLWIPL